MPRAMHTRCVYLLPWLSRGTHVREKRRQFIIIKVCDLYSISMVSVRVGVCVGIPKFNPQEIRHHAPSTYDIIDAPSIICRARTRSLRICVVYFFINRCFLCMPNLKKKGFSGRAIFGRSEYRFNYKKRIYRWLWPGFGEIDSWFFRNSFA